jgi:AhpD family alkylhydroperoxidase
MDKSPKTSRKPVGCVNPAALIGNMKYITPVPPGRAHGLVGDVYRQIKHDFGAVVDPFVVHSISPGLLAAVWGACRESELVGVVPREIKETIAVTISKSNQVPFCVDAHVVMLHALKAHDVAQALTHDRPDRLPERMRKAFEWSRTMPSEPGTPIFGEKETAEMIGTAVFFHYMNRVATVLLDETPLPSSREWLKGFLSRTAGWYFSFAARRAKTPGASLSFLPEAELPDDLAWAASSPTLAGAWARFALEVEQQGQASLPAETRHLATHCIGNWRGEAVEFGNGALNDAIRPLDPAQHDAARLVLLTALAPHRVDEKIVRDFADPDREQERLLGAISWASFAAARRIGSWLAPQGICDAGAAPQDAKGCEAASSGVLTA